MRKILSNAILISFLLIIFSVSILSTIGLETNKFNSVISDKINQSQNNLKLKFKTIKFKLDLKQISLFLETSNPEIKYRDELKEEVMQKYGINYQKHLEDLGKLRDKSSKLQQMSAAINAEKTRGQVGGLNIERKLIKVDVDYDKLSPEELQNTLNSMFNEDNEAIKNVTPVEDVEVLEEESNLDSDSEEK